MFWVNASLIASVIVAVIGLWGLLSGKMIGTGSLSPGETRWTAFFLLVPIAAAFYLTWTVNDRTTLLIYRAGSVILGLVLSGVVAAIIKGRPGRVPIDKCSRCGCRIFPEDVVVGVGSRLIDAGHSETAALAVMILGFKCNKCGRKFCLDCLSKYSHPHAYGGASCLSCGGSLSGLASYNLR